MRRRLEYLLLCACVAAVFFACGEVAHGGERWELVIIFPNGDERALEQPSKTACLAKLQRVRRANVVAWCQSFTES